MATPSNTAPASLEVTETKLDSKNLQEFVNLIRTLQQQIIMPQIQSLLTRFNKTQSETKKLNEFITSCANISVSTVDVLIPFADPVNVAAKQQASAQSNLAALQTTAEALTVKMQGLVTCIGQLDVLAHSLQLDTQNTEIQLTEITDAGKKKLDLPEAVKSPTYEKLTQATTVEQLLVNLNNVLTTAEQDAVAQQGTEGTEASKTHYEHTGIIAAIIAFIKFFNKEYQPKFKTDTEIKLTKTKDTLFSRAKAMQPVDENETSMGSFGDKIRSAAEVAGKAIVDAFSSMSQYNVNHYGVAYSIYTC